MTEEHTTDRVLAEIRAGNRLLRAVKEVLARPKNRTKGSWDETRLSFLVSKGAEELGEIARAALVRELEDMTPDELTHLRSEFADLGAVCAMAIDRIDSTLIFLDNHRQRR